MTVSSDWIEQTEDAMKVRLPGALRARLMRKNGGEVDLEGESWWLFPIRDGTDRRSIRKTANDIQTATRAALSDGLGFPADGVAIASNGAGDLLFLRAENGQLGQQVWEFRQRGGEYRPVLDDVGGL